MGAVTGNGAARQALARRQLLERDDRACVSARNVGRSGSGGVSPGDVMP
jgi:hypothetical protein